MMKTIRSPLLAIFAGSAMLLLAPAANAFDEEAAKALFKKNNCSKCHAPEKEKKGPSLKKIVKKNADEADKVAKLMKHLSSSPKVKLEDGTEEEHKMVETKDKAELQNLVEWILAQ